MQKPKIHFKLDLINPEGQFICSLYKKYKDFDALNSSLKATFKNVDSEIYNSLPPLPNKNDT